MDYVWVEAGRMGKTVMGSVPERRSTAGSICADVRVIF